MRIRFQADADIDPDIGRGLIRREGAIDWRPAGGFVPDGTPDTEVLKIAAGAGRVLVSRDIRSVARHQDYARSFRFICFDTAVTGRDPYSVASAGRRSD